MTLYIVIYCPSHVNLSLIDARYFIKSDDVTLCQERKNLQYEVTQTNMSTLLVSKVFILSDISFSDNEISEKRS